MLCISLCVLDAGFQAIYFYVCFSSDSDLDIFKPFGVKHAVMLLPFTSTSAKPYTMWLGC